ncbi:MAG: NAD(P)-binding domain-containing protein, partial [Actinobacteria bacterium]|nr:NAD(P)-binding domain-containing protein [Actinomycetota bacterium]
MIPLPFPDHRVIIVGAGQSGLAVASALCVAGLVPQKDFTVIDANAGAQRSWGSRWHSMELLSPARDSVITDRPLAGDPMRHPRADELAAYLDAIEASLGVTTMWGISATSVQHEDTSLVLGTTDGQFRAENVVCATGAAHVPWVPRWASVLAVPGAALHSADYSFPLQIPAGEVLIIGDGHSGMQLAQELLHSHTVT